MSILLGIKKEVQECYEAAVKGDEKMKSFAWFEEFIKTLSCTNDSAERNIGLIQRFVESSVNEDQRQNVLLVVRENSKLISKNMTQFELTKLKANQGYIYSIQYPSLPILRLSFICHNTFAINTFAIITFAIIHLP